MNVIITIEQGDAAVSVIADEKRRIMDIIRILKMQGYLPRFAGRFMRSAAEERVISTVNTLRDEGIASGDKLTEI
jgi:uncharacterized ubiquitin-like protein YukD